MTSFSRFYRATLCISADCALARCLSVSLSQVGIALKQPYRFSNFLPSGGSAILAFLTKRYGNILTGDQMQKLRKIAVFDQLLALSQK